MSNNTVAIHTTDRILYRRCRRKWNWQSPIRDGYVPIGPSASALWFGTGFHFALEDWHGVQRYQTPVAAFDAFVSAFRPNELPEDYLDLQLLASEMLTYYTEYWHNIYFRQFRTATGRDITARQYDGVSLEDCIPVTQFVNIDAPLTEVRFEIPLGMRTSDGKEIVYEGKFDRIVIDPYGRFWVVDFKTASAIDTMKLENDPQASAYTWAASKFFGIAFEGVIWLQFSKEVPKGPRQLVNGEFSQDKRQRTTYRLYAKALMETFGEIPDRYRDYLNFLAVQETENGDKFIRYDLLRKNEHWVQSEAEKIYYEASEMTNAHLPLYPNPTRDCAWDCPFRSPCLAMDDGSDVQFFLDNEYVRKTIEQRDEWRERLLPNHAM